MTTYLPVIESDCHLTVQIFVLSFQSAPDHCGCMLEPLRIRSPEPLGSHTWCWGTNWTVAKDDGLTPRGVLWLPMPTQTGCRCSSICGLRAEEDKIIHVQWLWSVKFPAYAFGLPFGFGKGFVQHVNKTRVSGQPYLTLTWLVIHFPPVDLDCTVGRAAIFQLPEWYFEGRSGNMKPRYLKHLVQALSQLSI